MVILSTRKFEVIRPYTVADINNIVIHNSRDRAVSIILQNGYALNKEEAELLFDKTNYGGLGYDNKKAKSPLEFLTEKKK